MLKENPRKEKIIFTKNNIVFLFLCFTLFALVIQNRTQGFISINSSIRTFVIKIERMTKQDYYSTQGYKVFDPNQRPIDKELYELIEPPNSFDTTIEKIQKGLPVYIDQEFVDELERLCMLDPDNNTYYCNLLDEIRKLFPEVFTEWDNTLSIKKLSMNLQDHIIRVWGLSPLYSYAMLAALESEYLGDNDKELQVLFEKEGLLFEDRKKIQKNFKNWLNMNYKEMMREAIEYLFSEGWKHSLLSLLSLEDVDTANTKKSYDSLIQNTDYENVRVKQLFRIMMAALGDSEEYDLMVCYINHMLTEGVRKWRKEELRYLRNSFCFFALLLHVNNTIQKK